MKRALPILLLILTLPLISAISIDLKEIYQPGQTLLATIQGNFVESLTTGQIYFYQGRIQIPLIYDLGKIQDKYYIYALLPNQEKNLSLIIKDAHYIENTEEYTQDIIQNFSVQGNLIDFSVSPGFIISNKDFEISIESKTKALTATANFLTQTQEVYIPEGQTKKITFSIKDLEQTTTNITVSANSISYTIPVLITKLNQTENKTPTSKYLKFSPTTRDIAVLINTERELKINLENIGNSDLKDITFEIPEKFKDIIIINPETLNLKSGESEGINLTIKPTHAGLFEDTIKAESEDSSTFFTLKLSVTENLTHDNSGDVKTCSYLGGEICASGKICDGETTASLEGNCCIGECIEKKSSGWKYFWLFLIIIILLAIAWFIFKGKKPKSSSEILKQKQEKAEKRFKPEQEVRGKLGRN